MYLSTWMCPNQWQANLMWYLPEKNLNVTGYACNCTRVFSIGLKSWSDLPSLRTKVHENAPHILLYVPHHILKCIHMPLLGALTWLGIKPTTLGTAIGYSTNSYYNNTHTYLHTWAHAVLPPHLLEFSLGFWFHLDHILCRVWHHTPLTMQRVWWR